MPQDYRSGLTKRDMLVPLSLKQGDTIAIVSPASTVRPEYIEGAVSFLQARGFNPVVSEHAGGPSDGSFSATEEQRLKDLKAALRNPEVKAILCSRGGYGAIHLLPHIKIEEVARNPKWLIGFSDISALHALWNRAGVASVHGPMAKHLSLMPEDDFYSSALMRMLTENGVFDLATDAVKEDRHGEAVGELRGGNLAVLNSLADTPYDLLKIEEDEDVILFFEDIGEKIYAVERMLSRLCMNGTIYRARGIVFGKFTEYSPDRNFQRMEEMLSRLIDKCNLKDIPVVFDFPAGHVDENFPLLIGGEVELTSTAAFRRLRKL